MRVRQVVGLLILLCGFQSIRTYGQVVATWTGSSGNYSNAANWSTLSVPKDGGGTFFNAVINGTGSDSITFDASGTVINSLMIGAGETFQDNGVAPTLKIGDPSFPAAGSLTNGGTINWGNGSTLALDITAGNGNITNSGAINLTNSTLAINDGGNGNTAGLSGGGSINLSGGTIAGSSGKETLQNNDNTIQGSGTISNLTLVNNSTINANGMNPLSLAVGGANNGTINVTGAGGLILSGQFANYGTLDINHSSLTGSYNNSIVCCSGPVAGTLVIENGSTATLAVMNVFQNSFGLPTIVRNGSTLSVGTLYNYQQTLEDLSGSVVTISSFIDNTNGSLLIDKSTMNIATYSSVANGQITVQNGGTLNVGVDYRDPFGTTSITGKSVANFLGTLNNSEILSFTVDNSVLNVAGDMVNENAGPVTFQNNSVGVIGGSLSNTLSTMTIDQSILTVRGNVINDEGNLTIQNAATLDVLGNVTNNASATMTLSGGSIVNVAGTFTNTPPAVLTMSGTNDVLNVQGLFTNAGSVTVGSLDSLNANGGFTNSGGTVSISSGGVLNTSNYSQSSGLTDVAGNLTAQSYSQAGGNTTIESGGKLTATTFAATGGIITVNGNLDPTAVEIGPNATLQGTGIIIGNVAMGGTLTPGAPGAPGTLTINGNYEQLSGGMLQEFMGPLSQSFLKVNGDVALDSGSFLDIILLNGYDPLGQSFNIIGYNSLVGEFSNGSSFWQDGFLWDLSYGQSGVEVTAVSTPEPSSLLLLFLGLAALASYAQQKKSKTQRLA
jgi:fibronectin-binding autotransporter adhesin